MSPAIFLCQQKGLARQDKAKRQLATDFLETPYPSSWLYAKAPSSHYILIMEEKKPDKEELIGLVFGLVSSAIKGNEAKRQSVGRYMRTYLRALTVFELEFELKYWDTNGSISPTLQFKVDQTIQTLDIYTLNSLSFVLNSKWEVIDAGILSKV